jgi:hypothetical protein
MFGLNLERVLISFFFFKFLRMKTKALLTYLLCCCMAPASLSAQAFTQIYRPLGISNELVFYRIAPAPDGGFFVAGQLETVSQIVVARLDAQGKPTWIKVPADQRSIYDLIALKDGSLLVFNNNGADASVLHLDPDGNFIDETTWGAPETVETLGGVVRLASGEILASGASVPNEEEEGHLFFVKFSEKGKVIWEKTIKHGFGSFFNIMEIPGGGGFYLAAQRFGPGPTAALCRLDAAGSFLWGKTYNFGLGEILVDHAVLHPDGNIFLSAFSLSDPNQATHIVLVKLAADGAPTWVKALSGPNSMYLDNMSLADAQTLVISGATDNQSLPVVDNDHFILRLTPDGKILGVMAHGSPTQDFPFDGYVSGEYMISCGVTLDGIPEGSTQNTSRAFISKSYLTSSGCSKNFSLTEVMPAPALPTVSGLTMIASTPPGSKKRVAEIKNFNMSVQTACQSVGVDSGEPCLGLEPDVLKAASHNLRNLLLEKAPLADAACLRVFDCTGKAVLETHAPNAHTLDEKPLPPGIYLYALELKACGKIINMAGKTAVFSN